MRIAYIILANRFPEQLLRLISRLNSNLSEFFIHIDRKADDAVYAQIVDGTAHLANVHLLKQYVCYWGGFGHIQASLEGIKQIAVAGVPFDYTILLTGQDYPIKSNTEIESFLKQQGGRTFIDHFPMPAPHWDGGGLQRIACWHVRWRNACFSFPRDPGSFLHRRFPRGLQPFGGSSYWCLSRACVAYIHDFVLRREGFVRFFKYVDVPDEIFYQTILLNSPLASTLVNDDLRYIEWRDPQSSSPAVLTSRDLEKIQASPKLYARKFDLNVDPNVLDLIDSMILEPARQSQ